MDRHSVDQQGPLLPFSTGGNQKERPTSSHHSEEKIPSSPSQHIRPGGPAADGVDIHPVAANEAEDQFPQQCHICEFCNNIPGPTPCSFDHARIIAAISISAPQIPSLAPSTLRQSDNSNVSVDVAPGHQTLSIPPRDPGWTSSTTNLQNHSRVPLSESLGAEGCAIIFGGFAAILGVFGFLGFLWFGAGSAPEAANATWLWRQLALNNWMPQAVTLSSLIVRFIVGINATICTSMIAALLLERFSIPRSLVAHASVMRGINDGPWKLMMLLLSYKGKASSFNWSLEVFLTILMALLSLALQFTSTILLSDMHPFSMVGDPASTKVNNLFSYSGLNLMSYRMSLKSRTAIHPVFGEVLTTHNSTPDARGFNDTGLKQRGLLPMLQSETRTSVRDYEGMGMVLSSRVACMRPIIANASLALEDSIFGDKILRRLQGVLDYGQSLQEARPGTGPLCSSSKKCERVAFDCAIPATDYYGTEATGGCHIDGVGGNLSGPDQPIWDQAAGPWSENSSLWLIYSTNIGWYKWESQSQIHSIPLGQPSDNSEWTIYEVFPEYFIKFAVCFSDFNFEYRDIRMTAAGETRERSNSWSLEVLNGSNIIEAESYLGLDPSHREVADRGILGLQIDPNAAYTPPPSLDKIIHLPDEDIRPSPFTLNYLQLDMNAALAGENTKNATFTLCPYCYFSGSSKPVNEKYAVLFSSILLGGSHRAGRAADALHAFINVVGFNVYYQYLTDTMDIGEVVRLVTTRVVTIPGSWPPSAATCTGLLAIVSLLAAYLALVAIITVLYVRHTCYTRYANVWHVVSQLAASEELEEAIELGNNAGDKAVVEGLRTKGLRQDDVLVKLGKADGCEKIKLKRM